MKIGNAKDVQYEAEEFIQKTIRTFIEEYRDYETQCSNQEFEMKEDDYPKAEIGKITDTDYGCYTDGYYYLTNEYYATVEISQSSSYYYKRMIYKIEITEKQKCIYNRIFNCFIGSAKITLKSLDVEKSIVYFSENRIEDTYPKCNLNRKYYTCKYYYCLLYNYREINEMKCDNNIKGVCEDNKIGKSYTVSISTKYISFDKVKLKREESVKVNDLLNSLNISSFSLPIGSSFVYNDNEYFIDDECIGSIKFDESETYFEVDENNRYSLQHKCIYIFYYSL